jgi:hypothetical protein
VWPFIVVVFYEFLVELESGVFQVVGSEPSLDLAQCCGFADSTEDMLDLVLLAVGLEA